MTRKTNGIRRPKESRQKRFLKAYSRCGNITEAARIAKVDRTMHYEWLKEQSEYSELFSAAQEQSIQTLESIARKRAEKSSDVLLIFLLKSLRPAVYRERSDLAVSGRVEHAGQIVVVQIPETELE